VEETIIKKVENYRVVHYHDLVGNTFFPIKLAQATTQPSIMFDLHAATKVSN